MVCHFSSNSMEVTNHLHLSTIIPCHLVHYFRFDYIASLVQGIFVVIFDYHIGSNFYTIVQFFYIATVASNALLLSPDIHVDTHTHCLT